MEFKYKSIAYTKLTKIFFKWDDIKLTIYAYKFLWSIAIDVNSQSSREIENNTTKYFRCLFKIKSSQSLTKASQKKIILEDKLLKKFQRYLIHLDQSKACFKKGIFMKFNNISQLSLKSSEFVMGKAFKARVKKMILGKKTKKISIHPFCWNLFKLYIYFKNLECFEAKSHIKNFLNMESKFLEIKAIDSIKAISFHLCFIVERNEMVMLSDFQNSVLENTTSLKFMNYDNEGFNFSLSHIDNQKIKLKSFQYRESNSSLLMNPKIFGEEWFHNLLEIDLFLKIYSENRRKTILDYVSFPQNLKILKLCLVGNYEDGWKTANAEKSIFKNLNSLKLVEKIDLQIMRAYHFSHSFSREKSCEDFLNLFAKVIPECSRIITISWPNEDKISYKLIQNLSEKHSIISLNLLGRLTDAVIYTTKFSNYFETLNLRACAQLFNFIPTKNLCLLTHLSLVFDSDAESLHKERREIISKIRLIRPLRKLCFSVFKIEDSQREEILKEVFGFFEKNQPFDNLAISYSEFKIFREEANQIAGLLKLNNKIQNSVNMFSNYHISKYSQSNIDIKKRHL